jgi:uncharacterized membrane protein
MWLQGGVAFVLWILYGASLARPFEQARWVKRAARFSRRGLLACMSMLVAAFLLFIVLLLIRALNGLSEDGLKFWAWLVVVATGLAFIKLQTFALVLVLANLQQHAAEAKAVTESRLSASTPSNPDIPTRAP